MTTRTLSKLSLSIIILLISGMIFTIGCAKKVSTTDIKEITGVEDIPSSKEPALVYEEIAEAPVPLPDTSNGNGRGEAGNDLKGHGREAAEQGIIDIYFDFDRYLIREDAREPLSHNSNILKKKKFKNLVIEGHADERGTSDYNLALGERRAASAKKYLTTMGIDSSKVSVITFGKEKPFCTEHNEECWQQNRRAHFGLAE